MGLILKGRTWYDSVYYPIYANQPALLAPSTYGAPRKRATPPPPSSTPASPIVEIIHPILPTSLFEREVFPFLMMMSMVLLRASKELVVVVEKPISELTETDLPLAPVKSSATASPTDKVPVIVYSGLAREVPYRYLGSKMVNSPESNHVDGLKDPIEKLAFPTVSEIVESVEVPTAMPPTSPITMTSIIPVEAERIAARFRELGGVEVVDSEALAAMLKEKDISSIGEYMSHVLKNCSPNVRSTTTPPPTDPIAANFTDPTNYVAPVWGDVGALTTNLSAMRKDGPFSRYRTLYRLYCRCRTALSRCGGAQVVPVDGKPSKKLAGKGRKPGMRASTKTPEEIAAIKELREAKKRKAEKKDTTTTEEERSLGFQQESKGIHRGTQPPSDEDDGAPDAVVREVDRFADSLLPYVTESLFLSICAGIQCNTFGIAIADDSTIGFSCFPFASYFNHSCEPNLARYMVHTDPSGGETNTADSSTTTLLPGGFDRVSFYTLCDIKKGEELNICYVTPQHEGNSRRRQLLQNYRFYCRCSRCRAGKKEVNAQFCKDCDAAGYLIPKAGGGTFCSICSKCRENPVAASNASATL
jgi:hypothetical protein